jgi:hypothetical protein
MLEGSGSVQIMTDPGGPKILGIRIHNTAWHTEGTFWMCFTVHMRLTKGNFTSVEAYQMLGADISKRLTGFVELRIVEQKPVKKVFFLFRSVLVTLCNAALLLTFARCQDSNQDTCNSKKARFWTKFALKFINKKIPVSFLKPSACWHIWGNQLGPLSRWPSVQPFLAVKWFVSSSSPTYYPSQVSISLTGDTHEIERQPLRGWIG